jgi:hypothetical protein
VRSLHSDWVTNRSRPPRSTSCETSRTMPHGAEERNRVPADSSRLRRTAQKLIRHSPELGIVPERLPSESPLNSDTLRHSLAASILHYGFDLAVPIRLHINWD